MWAGFASDLTIKYFIASILVFFPGVECVLLLFKGSVGNNQREGRKQVRSTQVQLEP